MFLPLNYFHLKLLLNYCMWTDEIDSYMYQTVGHHAVDLLAEAMELPLYRRTISGKSLETGSDYTENSDDEVEDLFMLLKQIKVSSAVQNNNLVLWSILLQSLLSCHKY